MERQLDYERAATESKVMEATTKAQEKASLSECYSYHTTTEIWGSYNTSWGSYHTWGFVTSLLDFYLIIKGSYRNRLLSHPYGALTGAPLHSGKAKGIC